MENYKFFCRQVTFICFVVLCYFSASAQAKFQIDAPQRVAKGEKFAVTYRLTNGQGSSIKVAPINGCRLIFGPSQSTRQSYQSINGQSSSTYIEDYTYYYLAEKEGKFTIPEASIAVDGKLLKTQAREITITPGRQSNNGPNSSRPQEDVEYDDVETQSSERAVAANDVFVRIIMSKSTAYEQEAIECTIKLYTKYSISSFLPTKQPSFDGFLIEELDVQPSLNEVEELNGQRYMTALLKKCIIFPQKSGKLIINSGNYDISVVQYEKVQMGLFVVQQPIEKKIKVSSNTASIEIQPLPLPQPEGFFGAVGQFTADSKLIGSSFRTNDPATLIYTISGTGNIKYLKEPEIDFPTDFELYSPKSEVQSRVSGNNVTGTMTIEYTFVPQKVGKFKIGSDNFVYFNPSTREYVTLSTPTYDINVGQGTAIYDSSKYDVTQTNTDILHIKTGDKNLSMTHSFLLDSVMYWIAYVILLGGLIGYICVNARLIKKRADVQGMRLAKASKVAKSRLKLASTYLKQKKYDQLYEELHRALLGYASDKLRIPMSQITRDRIAEEISSNKISDQAGHRLLDTIDECEMTRYTPVEIDKQSKAEHLYQEAVASINDIERSKRN